jgi:hypothetical protein
VKKNNAIWGHSSNIIVLVFDCGFPGEEWVFGGLLDGKRAGEVADTLPAE